MISTFDWRWQLKHHTWFLSEIWSNVEHEMKFIWSRKAFELKNNNNWNFLHSILLFEVICQKLQIVGIQRVTSSFEKLESSLIALLTWPHGPICSPLKNWIILHSTFHCNSPKLFIRWTWIFLLKTNYFNRLIYFWIV